MPHAGAAYGSLLPVQFYGCEKKVVDLRILLPCRERSFLSTSDEMISRGTC